MFIRIASAGSRRLVMLGCRFMARLRMDHGPSARLSSAVLSQEEEKGCGELDELRPRREGLR